jgi:DnaJ-class molecular chaperone
MKRKLFMLGLWVVLVVSSCARTEQRAPAYNPAQCPVCTTRPGVCSYCNGTGKCVYCNGTGKRHVVWPNIPEDGIVKGSYDDQCSFCKGTGACPYCGGNDKCWACKGTGTIRSWDFFEEYAGVKSK